MLNESHAQNHGPSARSFTAISRTKAAESSAATALQKSMRGKMARKEVAGLSPREIE